MRRYHRRRAASRPGLLLGRLVFRASTSLRTVHGRRLASWGPMAIGKRPPCRSPCFPPTIARMRRDLVFGQLEPFRSGGPPSTPDGRRRRPLAWSWIWSSRFLLLRLEVRQIAAAVLVDERCGSPETWSGPWCRGVSAGSSG